MKVHIAWVYENIPHGMSIYELKPGNWPVWKMGTLPSLKDAPITNKIESSTIEILRGQKRRFALVYQNTSDKAIYFFAAPHSAEPIRGTLGFKFFCLCNNHVYRVPPGQYWYRVVELRVAKNMIGDELNVLHHLIAVDETRAHQFQEGMRHEMEGDVQ